jgi:type I restriction enzyme S subunit
MQVGDFFDLSTRADKTETFDLDRLLTVKLYGKGIVKNARASLTGGANYFTRKAGQFIFSKIDLLNGAFGIIPDALDGFSSSSDVPAYSFREDQSSAFFISWLRSHYERLIIERTGTSNTLKRVSPEKFLALTLFVPSPAEQQKIADCLTSLDELITVQRQKVKALKNYKRGLMQQLFPREGETVPRLRFSEFLNAPEWETKLLGEVCEMQAGKFVAASEIEEKKVLGRYPCFGGNGLRGFTKTYTHSGHHPLIGRQGALCGNVNLVDGRFHATEHAVVTTPKAGNNVYWLFHALSFLNLNRFATGQAQPGLSVEVLEKVEITIPPSEFEQQCIADSLSSLDIRIAAESDKLDALISHKTGLMQQLFPSPQEA